MQLVRPPAVIANYTKMFNGKGQSRLHLTEKGEISLKKVFVILIGLWCLLAAGCGKPDVGPQVVERYLAVQDNQVGYLTLPKHTFTPIIQDLNVTGIAGIRSKNSALVLVDSGKKSGLYQIDLPSKQTVRMVPLADQAALSPDKKKVFFMTPDPGAQWCSHCLAYYDFQSKETVFVTKEVNGRVWWSGDSRKLLYSREETPFGGSYVYVYDIAQKKIRPVPSDGIAGLAAGWLNESPLTRETGLEKPLRGGITSYSTDTKGEYRNPVHYAVPFLSWLDIREDRALLCRINGDEITFEEWSIPSMKQKLLVKTPFYTEMYGYRSSVYFRARFINEHQVFYQVLTAENSDPVQAVLININTGRSVLLDKSTADVFPVF